MSLKDDYEMCDECKVYCLPRTLENGICKRCREEKQ